MAVPRSVINFRQMKKEEESEEPEEGVGDESKEFSQEVDISSLVNKICLVFPRIFWPLDTEFFGILHQSPSSQTRGKYFLIQNMYNTTKLPCLMIYCCAQGALAVEKLEDLAIQKEILTILSRIFPLECPIPYPIESIVTRWACDRYSTKSKDPNENFVVTASPANSKIVWTGTDSTNQFSFTPKFNPSELDGKSIILLCNT